MKNVIKQKENILILFILLSIIFIASLPAFRDGIYNGFDLWFHMGRIESIARELSNGQIPVRFETNSWYDNGYISTTMYGNLFLYIPALMHLMGVATYRCYNIYVIIINTLGVAVSMYSFTRLFKDKIWGLVATISYMLAGYYISNIYMRAAVGEYTATIFIPLIVYGLYRILYEELDKNVINIVLPLVIGVTGVLESHVLTTYMVAMMVFIFLLVYIKDTWNHIKELVVAFLLIIGANAFFLVPFIDAYTSHVFRVNQNSVGMNIQKYGLYIDQILGLFPEARGGRAEWSSMGEECSRIGIIQVFLFFVTILLIVLSIKIVNDEGDKKTFKRICVIFVIGLLADWLSSAYFPWGIFAGDNAISNIMRSVQYPDRYLLIQTIAWTICGVYSLKMMLQRISKKKQIVASLSLIVVVFVFALIQNGIFMYTLSCWNRTVQSVEGHESIADDLYLLSDVDMENVDSTVRVIDGTNCIVEDLGYDKNLRKIYIDNKSKNEATVSIPVFCYKYIEAKDSQGNVYELEATDKGQCKVSVVPGFSDTLYIHFVEPFIWRLSEMVSVICIVFLVISYTIGKKRK